MGLAHSHFLQGKCFISPLILVMAAKFRIRGDEKHISSSKSYRPNYMLVMFYFPQSTSHMCLHYIWDFIGPEGEIKNTFCVYIFRVRDVHFPSVECMHSNSMHSNGGKLQIPLPLEYIWCEFNTLQWSNAYFTREREWCIWIMRWNESY